MVNAMNSLMPIMNTNGTIYPLTATLQPTAIPLLPMNHRGVRIQGSTVASRSNVRSLLKYANEIWLHHKSKRFKLLGYLP
jgi:D-arabinose 1-dehydrogenase-like Zn-dependent alcohol dehydrogenase